MPLRRNAPLTFNDINNNYKGILFLAIAVFMRSFEVVDVEWYNLVFVRK